MNQLIRIGTGSRVEGSHGPLITNPNASIKRRVRSKAVGTVVKAAGPHKWDVVFDFDAKVKTVSSRSLTIVQNDAGIPLNEEGAVDTDPNVSIGVCIYLYCHRIISSLLLYVRSRLQQRQILFRRTPHRPQSGILMPPQ